MTNQALQEALTQCQERRDLLSFVKEVQQRHGYLSAEDMEGIAALWGIPVGEVYSVATFYSFLSTRRLGENVIKVCKSIPCSLKNCQVILESVRKKLDIRPGETTRDGKFSLQLTNCIGACDNAPAMMVNDEVYVKLTPRKIKTILESYAGNKGGSKAHSE